MKIERKRLNCSTEKLDRQLIIAVAITATLPKEACKAVAKKRNERLRTKCS